MSLEGLQVVLTKEPVVGTPAARRLAEDPTDVESMYLRHVRSYVPLGRAAAAGEDQMSVREYEQRLIRLVKEGKAPKGYVTADFGYGKTSTCAFIWERCREAGLLAVPPFQIEALDHLLLATWGWVRYTLDRSQPTLVPRADEIYEKYKVASIKARAGASSEAERVLEKEYQAGRYRLELDATDYLHFFEEMTALALEAGFAGLVVLVDEVQQYIDPAIKAGVRDPIAPLFDLVQALITRKGHLKFGLIFSIPSKELGVINDQRGDLIQRLKMDQLALDLRTIYDRAFAARLWAQLAVSSDFETEAPRIVDSEALRALGEIAARDDLSNGPRTVVNVFKVMTARYLESAGPVVPYAPLDLVDDFLAGRISFDGESKIQRAVNDALTSRLVAGQPDRERAIRLLAAFPTEGATPPVLEKYGLTTAANDLANLSQGELVIFVGGGHTTSGEEVPSGLTLRALEPVITNIDWLQITIREFTRNYFEASDLVNSRAVEGFLTLLRERIVTAPQWKVVETRTERAITQHRGLVVEGSFAGTRRKYPERVVHVRVLGDGAADRADRVSSDLRLDFVLQRNLDMAEGERRHLPGGLVLPDETHQDRAQFVLNLMHRSSSEIYRDLHTTLQPVVNPWKLTPLLMLSLYQYLEEKRAANLIPKADDPFVRDTFQPTLLDHCVEELFNAELGATLAANGARIVEETFRRICDHLVPGYTTLMVNPQWRDALRDYQTALERLPSRYEKQGFEHYSSSKETLAGLFNRSNTALDNFISSFGEVIEVIQQWQRGQDGVVRFKLHPLEGSIRNLLQSGETTARATLGGQRQTLHALPIANVYSEAEKLGYRKEEIDAILVLMEKRELITRDLGRGVLVEAAHLAPSLDQYRTVLREQQERIAILLRLFPDEPQLLGWQGQHNAMLAELGQPTKLTDQMLNSRMRTLTAYEANLDRFRESKRQGLAQDANGLLHNLAPFDSTHYSALGRPAAGALFSDQLNQQRVDLQRELARLESADARLRDQLIGLAADLNSPAHADAALERLQAALDERRAQVKAISQQAQQFRTIYQQYSDATRLLDDASALQNSIFELGEVAAPQRQALDTWSVQIRSEISSRKRAALANVVTWRDRLAEIKREVDTLRSQAVEGFTDVQQRYRDRLGREMGIPVDQLFEPLTYNPLDPQGSYNRLVAAVYETVQKLMHLLRARADELRGRVQQAQSSSSLDSLLDADRAALREQFGAALADIERARPELARLAALNAEAIRQWDQPAGEPDFAAVINANQIIRQHLNAAFQQVRAAEQRLGQVELKPDEARLYEAIRQLGTGLNAEVDLAGLLAALAPQQFDRQAVWAGLAALYDKRRLRIKLMVVSGD